MLSMHRAVEKMKIKTDYLLIDGNRAPYGHEEAKRPNGTIRKADPPQPKHIKMVEPIIKGDAKCCPDYFTLIIIIIKKQYTNQ